MKANRFNNAKTLSAKTERGWDESCRKKGKKRCLEFDTPWLEEKNRRGDEVLGIISQVKSEWKEFDPLSKRQEET